MAHCKFHVSVRQFILFICLTSSALDATADEENSTLKQGLQLSWPAPLPWHSKLYWGIQNPKGETVTSFLYQADETVGPYNPA